MIELAAVPAKARATHPKPRSSEPGLLTIGIDVGGTKTALVVTDADDEVALHEVVPTDGRHLVTQLDELIRRATDHFASDPSRSVGAVGIALPGQVDPTTGYVRLAVNLGGEDLALGPLLEGAVGLPCYVEHDARAAASWLESSPTQRGTPSDLAYLSLGTGISAGIVLDGRVLRGANGLAGEIGHVSADPVPAIARAG